MLFQFPNHGRDSAVFPKTLAVVVSLNYNMSNCVVACQEKKKAVTLHQAGFYFNF